MEQEELTGQILAAALQVHSALGPGLLESVYETCLAHEIRKRKLKVERQKIVPVEYDGLTFDEGFRIDLLVEETVIVELKTVEALLPLHEAQVLTYLRLTNNRVGLLINFKVRLLKQGIKRLII